MSVLDELSAAGYDVASIDELRESGRRYVSAIPILLRELERESDYGRKEWVVRALSVPWAKPSAIPVLLREFRSLPPDSTGRDKLAQWAIGNALHVLWDDKYFEEYVMLASDTSHGRAREMVVLGFEKSKLKEQATDVLLSLVDDPDLTGHAISALAKLAQPKSRSVLEAATSNSKTWIRNAAKRGIALLDKLEASSGGAS